MMTSPMYCYSHDLENNCTIIKRNEGGYYKTDFPEGGYDDDIINDMNMLCGITPEMREAMVCCSIAKQNNPKLEWDAHYTMVLEMLERRKNNG